MIKVLIADDNQQERELIWDVLSWNFAHRMELRMASNGHSAVETASQWGAELVLLDLELRELGGIETAQAILQQGPGCRVIFVTPRSMFRAFPEAVHLGVREQILKPVQEEDVIRAVGLAIEQLEARRELMELVAGGRPGGRNGQVIRCTERYLKLNYMYDLSLESMAALLGFSTPYFCRLFKQNFGQTFVEYLSALRIQAAEDLLRERSHSTAEVAGMVGYEDASYFARAFKKKTGMTPTEYRCSQLPAGR